MLFTRRTFLAQVGLASVGFWKMGGEAAELSNKAGLPRMTPAAKNVSASGVLDFLNAAEAGGFELHSFMLLREGAVVAEGWWDPYTPELNHSMYSMSKSFTSSAVGFAVAEGRLSVEDRVLSFFPREAPDEISENLAALRVKDLLTMTVGTEKEPTHAVVKEDNWVRAFLSQRFAHKPGTVFQYNSAATYMCSAIVQTLTGKTVLEYLTPRLFEPLGIESALWESCPKGINTGGWGLSVRTEGLAKFGQWLLQKGAWNGVQLLPASWIEEATSFHIQQLGEDKKDRPKARNDWLQGYGYQFWRCQNGAFRGDGAFGQFTVVMPEQNAVLVLTGESKNMQGELDLVWTHLLPALDGTSASTNAAAAALSAKTRSLKLALPTPKAPVVAVQVAGVRRFAIEANPSGITEVQFELKLLGCTLTIAGAKRESVFFAYDKWAANNEVALPWGPPRLISGGKPVGVPASKTAAAGVWLAENTLQLTLRYIETPHHETFTAVFSGDHVEIRFLNSLAALGGKTEDGRPPLKGRLVA